MGIEQKQAKLAAPDMSAWQTSIKQIEDRLAGLSQKTNAVANTPASSQSKKVIDEVAAAEAVAHKAKLSMLDQIVREDSAAAVKQIENASRVAAANRSYAAQAQQQLQQTRLQQLEIFGSMAGSIAQLARGTAFLFASTDEDMRKYLETLAKYQGVFDLIAGSASTLKNAINLWNTLTVAQNASAAAATRAAVANSAASVAGSSGGGSAVGGLAGQAAMMAGRFSLPLAAVATLAYAGYESYQESEVRPGERRQTAEEEARRERVRRAEEHNDEQLRRLQMRGNNTSLTQSLIGAGALTNSEAMEQVRGNQNSARFQYNMSNAAIDPLAGPTYTKEAELLVEYSKQSIDNYKQLLDLANQQTQALQQQASTYQSIAEASKNQLEQEQRRYETLEEKIGRLSEADVARLKRIAEAQKEGKDLSLEDASFLESTGVGTKQARKRFRQEADARGADDLLQSFGERDNLDNLEATDASTQATATQQIDQLTTEIDRINEQRKQDLEKLVAAITTNLAASSELDQLRREIEKFNEEQKRKAASQR